MWWRFVSVFEIDKVTGGGEAALSRDEYDEFVILESLHIPQFSVYLATPWKTETNRWLFCSSLPQFMGWASHVCAPSLSSLSYDTKLFRLSFNLRSEYRSLPCVFRSLSPNLSNTRGMWPATLSVNTRHSDLPILSLPNSLSTQPSAQNARLERDFLLSLWLQKMTMSAYALPPPGTLSTLDFHVFWIAKHLFSESASASVMAFSPSPKSNVGLHDVAISFLQMLSTQISEYFFSLWPMLFFLFGSKVLQRLHHVCARCFSWRMTQQQTVRIPHVPRLLSTWPWLLNQPCWTRCFFVSVASELDWRRSVLFLFLSRDEYAEPASLNFPHLTYSQCSTKSSKPVWISVMLLLLSGLNPMFLPAFSRHKYVELWFSLWFSNTLDFRNTLSSQINSHKCHGLFYLWHQDWQYAQRCCFCFFLATITHISDL